MSETKSGTKVPKVIYADRTVHGNGILVRYSSGPAERVFLKQDGKIYEREEGLSITFTELKGKPIETIVPGDVTPYAIGVILKWLGQRDDDFEPLAQSPARRQTAGTWNVRPR